MADCERSTLIRIIAACALALPLSALAADTPPSEDRRAYDAWVAKYGKPSLNGTALVVTVIEHDTRVDRQRGSGYISTVTTDGNVRWESFSDFGTKGGGGNKIPDNSLSQLKDLAAKLPAAAGRLPPAERRVLVQTPDSTRVYDRAALSDDVTELLRLSGCGVGAWVPKFADHSEIDASPLELSGFLALSPDGKQLLFSSRTLQFWDATTHETLGDTRALGESLNSIAFSPDGALAAISGWGSCQIAETQRWRLLQKLEAGSPYDPRFTPDGLHLVLRCRTSELRIFNTRTWKPVENLPEIAPDVVQWIPASSWQRAVVGTKTGVLSLLDTKSKTAIELDKGITLKDAAFSPDQTQVVVASADTNGYSHPRLRLFRTDTGQLVHELRPYEAGCEKFTFTQWTGDGHYILAATKSHSFFTSEGISVWNAQTGRHRGEFTGCPTSINGVVQLPGGDELVAGCNDGHIRFWDFAGGMKLIKLFEQSLDSETSMAR